MSRASSTLLPNDRMEWVESWGMDQRALSWVYRPSTVEGVASVLEAARRSGRSVGLRGAGRSYGDASLNTEGICLDLTRMNRILDWDPEEGLATVEPGVTVRQLWEYAIDDGWWPAVVPGTMFPTLAGMAAMNVHGKNAYKVGPIGDQIEQASVLLPSGESRIVSRERDPGLFHGIIGGAGMLGVFTSLTLRLKRVHSGLLEVDSFQTGSLRAMIDVFEENAATSDYMVGWVDCFAGGKSLGRNAIHLARYLKPGDDPAPAQSLRVERQQLPDTLFGFIPKSMIWMGLYPFTNDWGMRMVNTAKVWAGRLPVVAKPRYQQSHAAFAFLLDYVPNWKWGYKPGGLVQFQSFVPRDRAAEVFEAQLRLMRKRGIYSYLGVFKKHRPDPFLLTHGLDGYSLALDFPVNDGNRAALRRFLHELEDLAIEAGGRLYFAKDSAMRPGAPRRYLPAQNLAAFERLRAECDPEGILSTDLYRRVFADGATAPRRRAARSAR
ncbi:MAG: FAD-binding oxidoreductase [Candidatus Sumerlaeia bacterium]|nr:FAD-binding oxidoreductase [Candidatus Sumerlaeia bacterium]